MAVRHIGRALRAMSRAGIDVPDAADGKDRWALYDGERHLGQASDRMIDALEIMDGPVHAERSSGLDYR